jgi:hypothetical protein
MEERVQLLDRHELQNKIKNNECNFFFFYQKCELRDTDVIRMKTTQKHFRLSFTVYMLEQ